MLKLLILLISATLTLSRQHPLHSDAIAVQRDEDVNYRLPTNVVPRKYNIVLEPLFSDFTFEASIRIQFEVIEPTNSIVFHKNNLNITSILVMGNDLVNNILDSSYDETTHFFTILLEEILPAGLIGDIVMTYVGELNDRNQGFYRGNYLDETGNERLFAATHFETSKARQAFPCFDEPALKAAFTINLIRPADYNSISNTNLDFSDELSGNRVRDTFKATPNMSTYLIAFVVSDFEFVATEGHNVYATKQSIDQNRGDYALEKSSAVISAMEQFTGVPFNLEKITQVAVPDKYFSAGAMENWGLVLYKAKLLLFDPSTTTSLEKQSVVTTIAHEYGHQWFGDLVSPLWWDYLWLNEGFATYFECIASSVDEPSWRLEEQILLKSVQPALEVDALNTTRAMSMPVDNPITAGIFDSIAYEKSGSVLRMTEHFLSRPIFQMGLQIYLTKMQYLAAQPNDLFDGLQEAYVASHSAVLGDLTVHQILDTWHLQKGYPLITATRDYEQKTLNLKQNKYQISENEIEREEIWNVPINYATSNDFSETTPTYWLTEREATINLDSDSWVILNKKATGYFRINYDKTNWELITNQLLTNPLEIDPLNRAQLIDDVFDLAKSGDADYLQALQLMQYIALETDFIPLKSLYEVLKFFNYQFYFHTNHDEFSKNMWDLLKLSYDNLGHLNSITNHLDILNREDIIYWMCILNFDECKTEIGNALLNLPEFVDPDLQNIIYCSGMRDSNNVQEKFDILYNKYHSNLTEDYERSRLLSAMGCTNDEVLMERILKIAISEDSDYSFKPEDRYSAFRAVYTGTVFGNKLTFDYTIANYDMLTEKFGDSELGSIFTDTSKRLGLPEVKEKLEEFLTSGSLSESMENSLKTSIANVEKNIKWNDNYAQIVADFYASIAN